LRSVIYPRSIGCAFSGSFPTLVSFRVLQGFAGGALIPAVFSAVFLLFPIRLHPIATTMAGIMAVLAPTVGPVVGGWITETYSWHWLFLINVAPGVIAAAATPFLLPNDRPRFADLATLDGYSLTLMAISLASLEIGLKQAPQDGWLSPLCALLFALSAAAATAFVVRTLKATYPVVELSTLRNRSFAIGCGLSFCLGVDCSAHSLMPVFPAYARRHDAFEIGTIMLVTGVAQLVAAPIAGPESRLDPRWLSAAGFGLFTPGLGCSAFQSRVADFDEMFCRKSRGVAISGACAADPAGAGRADRSTGARCQRPVQSDAKPWRRDRHRPDRYHPLWTHRWTRRGAARPADRRRRYGGTGDRA
jgi:DHA2 family multidrug resistance protein